MQLKLYQVYQVMQILEKLKLYKKLKIMIMQLNIMIFDIDKKKKDI